MTTKYDVGDHVGIEGKVVGISISDRSVIYKVQFDGEVHTMREDEIFPLPTLDFPNDNKE